VSLKRGRVLSVAQFEPRSWTGEIKRPALLSPQDPTKSTILSIAARNPVVCRIPIAATPTLAGDLSDDGSVAQSQGFRSVPPFGSRGLA